MHEPLAWYSRSSSTWSPSPSRIRSVSILRPVSEMGAAPDRSACPRASCSGPLQPSEYA